MTDTAVLTRHFADIGARVKVHPPRGRPNPGRTVRPLGAQLDVGHDRKGEFFDLALPDTVDATVLQRDPKDGHLLLMLLDDGVKSRYLFGHDERHLFVAAIPEKAPVSTVAAAKAALQPRPVKQLAESLRPKQRQRHRTSVYLRQGEWFFVPESDLVVSENEVLRHEPLQRGRARPHFAEYAWRTGGQTRYISSRGTVLTPGEWDALDHTTRRAGLVWRQVVQNPTVYVKGRITHPEHRTRILDGWHKVISNTESEALAMRSVAFFD